MPDGDYYSVLGVSPEVSGSAIQAAYDRLKQQATDGQLAQSELPAIDEAFQTLGDPIRRLRYDAQQSAPPPPRFQMPEVNLPGRRLRVGLPFRGRRLPGLPQVDPIVGGAVALVLAVGIVVALLFVTRGRGSHPPLPNRWRGWYPRPPPLPLHRRRKARRSLVRPRVSSARRAQVALPHRRRRPRQGARDRSRHLRPAARAQRDRRICRRACYRSAALARRSGRPPHRPGS